MNPSESKLSAETVSDISRRRSIPVTRNLHTIHCNRGKKINSEYHFSRQKVAIPALQVTNTCQNRGRRRLSQIVVRFNGNRDLKFKLITLSTQSLR